MRYNMWSTIAQPILYNKCFFLGLKLVWANVGILQYFLFYSTTINLSFKGRMISMLYEMVKEDNT